MVKPKRFRHLVKIAGIGDHGVSLGVKLFDPEGNEIEVFYSCGGSSGPMARYSPVDSQRIYHRLTSLIIGVAWVTKILSRVFVTRRRHANRRHYRLVPNPSRLRCSCHKYRRGDHMSYKIGSRIR